MKDDHNDGDWKAIIDASTTLSDVEALIEPWTRWALDALRAQLDADAEVSAIDRARILAVAEPVARAQTRAAFMSAWQRHQHDADASPTVH